MNKNLLLFAFFVMLVFFPFVAKAQDSNDIRFIVAEENCGSTSSQKYLVRGDDYLFSSQQKGLTQKELTCNFSNSLIYAFANVDINAQYKIELLFFSDQQREIEVKSDGNLLTNPIFLDKNKLTKRTFIIPQKAYAYGQFVLFLNSTLGPNAVLSSFKIYSNNPEKLTPFSEKKKAELSNQKNYNVNLQVDVESVLPTYTPIPKQTEGVYQSKISLDGVWLFSEDEKAIEWKDINVPGEWAMQGFKVDSAKYALYQREINIPEDWKQKQVHLRFDGVHSEYYVYLNHQKVGYHMGGMTPYEIDVTKYLNGTHNILRLKVRSESTADMLGSLTQYAAHQLGGITRKVTLFATPKVYVSDVRVVTDLDEHYEDATLKTSLTISNKSEHAFTDGSIVISLHNSKSDISVPVPVIQKGETYTTVVNLKVNNPQLWTNETPNLYQLNLSLFAQNAYLEGIEKQIGFREIEIKGNELFLNGKAIKLHGVCRHESHPLTGRVLTSEQRLQDAKLYRAANCNFIRTSHYPPSEEFIEYCDKLGLLVEVEAPICWIGHGANENWKHLKYDNPIYYDYVLQANMEMIHFYRNHPSIIMWSMANESYWNREFAQVQVYVNMADSTRPHTFHDQAYGGFNNQGSTAPISNIHYPGPDGYKHAQKSKRPMVYGEFCHLNVYNRSELVTDPGIRSDWALALKPTWEKMYATKGVLGGSIWSGIDDIFQMPNGNAVGYGAWGPIDGWRRMKPEYWDIKKIFSPIKVLTKSLESSSNSCLIKIENRYNFLNLDQIRIEWNFRNQRGTSVISISPKETGILPLPISKEYLRKGGELSLKFIDNHSEIVDEYLIPVGYQEQDQLPKLSLEKTKIRSKRDKYHIYGKDFSCIIEKSTGQITSLKVNGKEMIVGGPYLMVLPLKGGGCYPNHNAKTPVYNSLCQNWTVTNITQTKTSEGVVIKVTGKYDKYKGGYSILLNSNGSITVDYSFDVLKDVNPRQWGLVFESPNSFNQTFWRRKGLWSLYPSNHISRSFGVAQKFYSDVPFIINPRIKPTWSWSKDYNSLGSNDFRATRRNIWYAGLKESDNAKIIVESNSKQHFRCWQNKEKIQFLVADFVTAGNEMFLGSYLKSLRKPLKVGDKVQGRVTLRTRVNKD